MGKLMPLIDVIRNLESFDEDGAICAAKPWTEKSQAIVVVDLGARGLPAEAQKLGLEYLLDVFIARNFLEDWCAGLDMEPTIQEKCARIIKYAITDA